MSALALGGWALALAALVTGALVVRVREARRDERLACAEHEIRGGLCGMTLALGSLARRAEHREIATGLQHHLDRAASGVEDLLAARTGIPTRAQPRPVVLEEFLVAVAAAWNEGVASRGGSVTAMPSSMRTTVDADPRRLTQAIGNAVANAVEHGGGEVGLSTAVVDGRVRVAVEDMRRGRGLSIATAAARSCGGELRFERATGGAVTTLDLPLAVGR